MIKTQHQQPNYQNNQPKEDDFDEIWVPNPHGLPAECCDAWVNQQFKIRKLRFLAN
jgi:hypothetical protein